MTADVTANFSRGDLSTLVNSKGDLDGSGRPRRSPGGTRPQSSPADLHLLTCTCWHLQVEGEADGEDDGEAADGTQMAG